MIHDTPSETYPDEGKKLPRDDKNCKSHMNYLENKTSFCCL